MRAKESIKKTISVWSKSKTMLLNGLTVIIMVSIAEGWLGIDLEPGSGRIVYTSLLIPVINMILRYFTNYPLRQKEKLLE